MGDFDFKLLLHEIRNGNVVPIIGTELYVDDQGRSYDTLIARNLATALGLQIVPDGTPDPGPGAVPESATPRDVGLAYLVNAGGRLATLRAEYQTVIRQTVQTPPRALQQLAEISDFKLYVTTALDRMMEEALARANRGMCTSLSYSLKKFDLKLPDLANTAVPAVCHLLGNVNEDFALGDADVIEYLQALLSHAYRPVRLYDELQSRNLLFMGCGFPDWLSRLFIRTIKDAPFQTSQSETRSQFIADSRAASDRNLKLFLTHYNVQLHPSGPATAFVDTLHTQWKEQQQQPKPAELTTQKLEVPPGSVFLSFSSEDRTTIRDIAKALEDNGIDVWFDETDIEKGVEWDPWIEDGLMKAMLFVPFISSNTERLANTAKYFWREWNIAERRSTFLPPGTKFILPVALDVVNPATSHGPRTFKDLQWFDLRGRTATTEFIDFIKTEYRRRQGAR